MDQIALSTDDLQTEATSKVLRLREIRETIAQGGNAASEVEKCLSIAARAVAHLSRPEACFGEVQATPVEGGIALINGPEILNDRLCARLEEQTHEPARIYIYGLSLGYDTGQMMAELNGDYSLYHFHYYISRTMLQLIGRELINQVRTRFEDRSWYRFPVLSQIDSDPLMFSGSITKKHYWDPERIAMLLPYLNESQTRYKVTDAGCISPLFSIIGIMLSQALDGSKQR